jgi:hypothetical protein
MIEDIKVLREVKSAFLAYFYSTSVTKISGAVAASFFPFFPSSPLSQIFAAAYCLGFIQGIIVANKSLAMMNWKNA